MGKYFQFIYLLFILLPAAFAEEGFVQLRESRPIVLARRARYLTPNELRPSDGADIFARAPAGVLVGVGADRIYFAYLLSPSVSHVLVVDHDHDVIRYHQINDLLMRMSPPAAREIYLKLRSEAGAETWVKQARWAADYGRLSEAEFTRIAAGPAFTWWEKNVRRTRKARFGIEASEQTNYLEYDPAFRRLQSLFERRRFQAHHLELNRESDVKDLIQALEITGLPLSMLDLSNAAMPHYVDEPSLRRLLHAFTAIADPESLIVATKLRFAADGKPLTSYLGVKFQTLPLYPTLVPRMISRFSDGRKFDYPFKKLAIANMRDSICDDLLINPAGWDIKLNEPTNREVL